MPIFLHGLHGSGKSHLLNATCALAGEFGKHAMALSFKDLPLEDPQALDGLDDLDLLCLDDLQVIAGQSSWEDALFGLFNALQDRGSRLIVAATSPPAALPFSLEDLRSRLSSGPVIALKPLSEEASVQALIMKASAKGMILNEAVSRYLIKRVNRDLASLIEWLERIEEASLSAGRPITIPMVRQLLESNPD